MKLQKIMILGFVFMLISMFAFGAAQSEATSTGYGTPGQWPLAETLTLTAGIEAGDSLYDPSKTEMYTMMEELTNVHIEWVALENDEKRNIIFASGDYPDMAFGNGRWQSFNAEQLNEGVVLDLVPFFNKGYTPNLDGIFAEYPNSFAYMKNPQGQIQALANFGMIEFGYLENNFSINVDWLKKVGMEKPTTTDELYEVLIAFRDQDPNGNGKQDEIPFSFTMNHNWENDRPMYGQWGLPVKDSAIAVRNGKVLFAPVEPGYKDFIKYFTKLYAEGLLDPEAFTQQSLMPKVDNPDGNTVGAFVGGLVRGTEINPNRYEFESMSPLQVPGYPKPEIWMHPGMLATKNMWIMTDKNPQPEITMAWMDLFYTLENTLMSQYGPLDGEGIKQIDGKWSVQEVDPEYIGRNMFPTRVTGATLVDDYKDRIQLGADNLAKRDAFYTYYDGYQATEQWSRSEATVEESETINLLRTDIEKLWRETEVRWITGEGDVDKEWDAYVAAFEKMGLADFIAAYQSNIDRYMNQ